MLLADKPLQVSVIGQEIINYWKKLMPDNYTPIRRFNHEHEIDDLYATIRHGIEQNGYKGLADRPHGPWVSRPEVTERRNPVSARK